MKRCVKLISVVLAASMMLSFASCAKRRTGAERILSDESAKPEFGTEVTYTDPTETDPTAPQPTETEPTSTKPSSTGNSEQGIIALLQLGESVCGMTPDDATPVLAGALGLTDYTIKDSDNKDSSGKSTDRYLRYLDKDIISEGVVFKNVSMHMKNGIVYSVDYGMRVEAIFAQNEELASEEANNTLVPIITAKYGDPIPGYQESWVDFDKNGITGWQDGQFIICAFWGKGCQGVKGNDQFVVGVEYKGNTNDPGSSSGNGATPTPSGKDRNTSTYLFIAGLLFVGGDHTTTKMFIESTYGIKLGNPVSTDKSSTSPSFTAYTYDCKIEADGVVFNRLEIDVCDSNNRVFQVSFINNTDDEKDLVSYQKAFAQNLSKSYGKQLSDKSEGDVTIQYIELDSKMNIESGCAKGNNKSFWISFYNETYLA